MSRELSRLMKTAIIINIFLILIASSIHAVKIYEIYDTNAKIVALTEEHNFTRDTAIRMLQDQGVEIDMNFSSAIFSFCICIAAIFASVFYYRNPGFLSGFLACFFGVFATYVGGFILFYLFFSGRSEKRFKDNRFSGGSGWQRYLHERAI